MKSTKLNDLIYMAITDIKTAASNTGISITDKTIANLIARVIEEHQGKGISSKTLLSELNAGFKFAAVIENVRTKRTITGPEEVVKRGPGRPRKLTTAGVVNPTEVKRGPGRPRTKPHVVPAPQNGAKRGPGRPPKNVALVGPPQNNHAVNGK
jgi:hypothetical protein